MQRVQEALSDLQQRVQQRMRLSPGQLVASCAQETQHYMEGKPSDDSYALALFRLAIVKQDQAAWDSLYKFYAPLVGIWMKQRRRAWALLGEEACTHLVDEVFERFEQAMNAEKIVGFSTLAAVLCYLKLTTHTTLAEALRERQRTSQVCSLEQLAEEPSDGDPIDIIGAMEDAQELWRDIENNVHSDKERALLYLTLIHGMTPQQIQRHAPHLFPTVNEIYRIKKYLMPRLRGMRSLQERRAATLGRPWPGKEGTTHAKR